jgi:phage FluMu gp28-like protein
MNELVTAEDWARHRRETMAELPAALRGVALPDVLLPYQKELMAATAAYPVVVTDKSRRIGMTWAVGADAVLTSGAAKSAGGMDTLYIGYNLDMAREFIDVCAMWAKAFMPACSQVDEFLFIEQDDKGADRAIQAFRITFASGFEIVALSSRPRSLRGRQGFVILDEFAFHDDAGQLLKAAVALLIWGGKVLVISTHNGEDNPFNELITEIRAKSRPGHVVRCTFDDALQQGLYQRICLVKGKTWSIAGEAAWRAETRAYYGSDAAEELDCIPSQGSGVYLTGALIEACMTADAAVLRLTCPIGFELKSDAERASHVDAWLEENVEPLIGKLDARLRHGYGFDFGRSGDLSVLTPLAEGRDLVRRTPFVIELRNVPFREQERVLFYVVDHLPRFSAGKHDARGNGQAIAEYAVQKYGPHAIEAVMPTQLWYLASMPPMKQRLEDRMLAIPRDADLKGDLRLVRMVRGIAKVPDNAHTKGSDGGQRHGDFAVSLCLANAAMDADPVDYGYRGVQPQSARDEFRDQVDDDDDRQERNWWNQPLGAGLRGGL